MLTGPKLRKVLRQYYEGKADIMDVQKHTKPDSRWIVDTSPPWLVNSPEDAQFAASAARWDGRVGVIEAWVEGTTDWYILYDPFPTQG